MLTIAKLGVGQEAYYLAKVADGIEDYYSGRGETTGEWLGRGAVRLGLTGPVTGQQLRAALASVDPHSGQRLAGHTQTRRVPGWDLTFCAPKSVSVLHALSDPHIRANIVDAHQAAVAAGLDYLERHAAVSRRRVGGDITQVRVEGLVVAAFRHRTSRAGDPHLHTHALAANLVERIDGGWGALHSPVIYRHARTAGFVYQAILRSELTDRLGITWTDVHNGYAEIAGIHPGILHHFSKRHTAITEELTAAGESSARAADIAQRRTRPQKEFDLDTATLHDRWHTEARAMGFDPTRLHYILGAQPPLLTSRHRADAIDDMVSAYGLTSHNATFEERDVIRAWCQALPAGAKTSLDELETHTRQLLADSRVVPIVDGRSRLRGHEVLRDADGQLVTASRIERRWSTTEMLNVELRLLALAADSQHTGIGQIPQPAARGWLQQRLDLSAEQGQMVHHITTSGHGVDVVVGRAGTGKTYALAAAADIWRAHGYQPIGVCLAARAACELRTSAQIPSTTIARFLIDTDQAGPAALHHRNIVVIDEAAMVDTRQLARVLTHTHRARAKLVLVGDHHQLPAVEVGGAFAGLVTRLGATDLAVNRRQLQAWERHALDRLRVGEGGRGGIADTIATYDEHGRIHIAATPADARTAMVADWYHARRQGHHAGMVALRRADVRDLNHQGRQLLIGDGSIEADGLTIGGTTFARGDRVVCLRGDRLLGVHNGLFATVTDIDQTNHTITIQPDDQPDPRTLLPSYLQAEHLDHAYATTINKAQGATHDRTFLLGDDHLYRQAGYTGLSRGRHRNDIYITADNPRTTDPDLEPHGTTPDDDPFDRLTATLHRDRAKTLATDQHQPANRWGATTTLAELVAQRDALAATIAGDDPERLTALDHTIDYRTALAGRAAEIGRPRHTVDVLGTPPVGPEARQQWRDAAATIEVIAARASVVVPPGEPGLVGVDVPF